jgi:Zn-dependent protease with chaperone function
MSNFYAYSTPWGTIRTGALFEKLTPREQAAVQAHERGHIVHKHVLKRMLWLFSGYAVFHQEKYYAMCRAQEFEADSYAVKTGHAAGLAMVLTRIAGAKTNTHPSKQERLARLCDE